MDFSKLKNKFLIVLCLFIFIFPFALITKIYAYEGELIERTVITGIQAVGNSNAYTSGTAVSCYPVRKGYKYTIVRVTDPYARYSVYSSDYPALNVPFELVYVFSNTSESEYIYVASEDGYLAINGNATGYEVYETLVSGMEASVDGLVSNVGLSQFWNVFNISINYIIIVVLFAFGFFIIVALIKKLRKGKGGI